MLEDHASATLSNSDRAPDTKPKRRTTQRVDYESRFYVALKRIADYMSPERLRRVSEKQYGLDYTEALEMSYENMQGEALSALEGYRRRRK